MKLKKGKCNKTCRVILRCNQSERYVIEQKANIYCDGNISEYLRYAALNFIPGKEDFEEDKSEKIKKRRKI